MVLWPLISCLLLLPPNTKRNHLQRENDQRPSEASQPVFRTPRSPTRATTSSSSHSFNSLSATTSSTQQIITGSGIVVALFRFRLSISPSCLHPLVKLVCWTSSSANISSPFIDSSLNRRPVSETPSDNTDTHYDTLSLLTKSYDQENK